MEIGIIGKGKMGREIFNHLFQFDDNLVIICRKFEDIETLRASIEKQLRKMLRRGYLTDSDYEKKRQSFVVSNDLSALKNCNLVIESIYEDKQLKQDIFSRLESIVEPECILATNTSSIPLNIIFEGCSKKNRCLGIHFFFPVKLTKTVEINRADFTDEKYVQAIKGLLERVDKTSIELKEESNMILNKILLTMMTEAFRIYEESYLTLDEIDEALKSDFLTLGLFEIIDSIGIKLIVESVENFIDDRYRDIYTPFHTKGSQLIDSGYSGGPGNKGFIDYSRENIVTLKKVDEKKLNEYKENIVKRLQSLLINELAFLVKNQYVEKNSINHAVKEVLGLSEEPIDTLRRIGKEKIMGYLSDSYERTGDGIYKPLNLDVLSV